MKPTKQPFSSLTREARIPYLEEAHRLVTDIFNCKGGRDAVAAALYEFRLSLETRTQEELAFEQYKYGACESCKATDVYLTAYGHQRDGLQYVCPQCFLNYELDHRRMPDLKDMQSAFPHYGVVQSMRQRDLEKNLKFMENYGTKNPTRESYIVTPEKAQELVDAFHQNFKQTVNHEMHSVKSGELSSRGKPTPEIVEPNSPDCYEKLWEDFRKIPVKSDEIQEPFLHFEPGDLVTDVWAWFDEKYEGGCHDLMYGKKDEPVLAEKVHHPLKGDESTAIIDVTSQPDKGNDSE